MNRIVTEAERGLLSRITMFGSSAYPIKKLGKGWIWETEQISGPPVVFKTKKEATANFELFLQILNMALGYEAKERAIADRRARGYSEEEIQREIAAAEKHAALRN